MESTCFQLHFSLRCLIMAIFFLTPSPKLSVGLPLQVEGGGVGRRGLLSFKETPAGGNSTFECSPSGPCVPCQYSEKTEEKYRCSETGYRIPLKCVKFGDAAMQANSKRPQNSRSVLEGSDKEASVEFTLHDAEIISSVKHRTLLDHGSKGEPEDYITYRSCIPAVNEEKLSVLGFEVFTLGLLLISGSVVFFRRKRTAPMAGVGGVRVQSNARF
ncbi:hypothetical protein Ancab_020594 [Ancistrocladus abbreviatus]